jgi:hypothetical protein
MKALVLQRILYRKPNEPQKKNTTWVNSILQKINVVRGEKMTKWEYVSIALVKGILDAGVKTQEELLNKYGLDGWELVSIVALQINQSFEVVAYLKRQLKNESELANNEPKGNS